MKHALQLVAVAIAAGALVGCGGAKIQSKEQAAGVAFHSGDAANGAQSKGAFLRLFQSANNFTGAVTVDCTHGGTTTLRSNVDTSDLSGLGSLTLEFDGCTEPAYDDPQTTAVEHEDVVYDGKLTVSFNFDFTDTNAAFGITMKGRVDLGGAYSDYVEMDLTETFSATTTQNGATSSFEINGTVDTSSEHYAYDHETYDFTAEGQIVKDGAGA